MLCSNLAMWSDIDARSLPPSVERRYLMNDFAGLRVAASGRSAPGSTAEPPDRTTKATTPERLHRFTGRSSWRRGLRYASAIVGAGVLLGALLMPKASATMQSVTAKAGCGKAPTLTS